MTDITINVAGITGPQGSTGPTGQQGSTGATGSPPIPYFISAGYNNNLTLSVSIGTYAYPLTGVGNGMNLITGSSTYYSNGIYTTPQTGLYSFTQYVYRNFPDSNITAFSFHLISDPNGTPVVERTWEEPPNISNYTTVGGTFINYYSAGTQLALQATISAPSKASSVTLVAGGSYWVITFLAGSY